MRKLSSAVRARQDAYAPGLRVAWAECDPGSDMLVGGEAEIGAVLMPGHSAGGALGFPPHGGVEHQDIVSDQVLDRVQDRRFAHQAGGPGEQQIWFHTIRNSSRKRRGGL